MEADVKGRSKLLTADTLGIPRGSQILGAWWTCHDSCDQLGHLHSVEVDLISGVPDAVQLSASANELKDTEVRIRVIVLYQPPDSSTK
jgi:hypothetical protein